MNALQIIVNIVLAVLAFLLVKYVLDLVIPGAISWLVAVVVAVIVFVNNLAARIGVN